jgi:hypothetical protein
VQQSIEIALIDLNAIYQVAICFKKAKFDESKFDDYPML